MLGKSCQSLFVKHDIIEFTQAATDTCEHAQLSFFLKKKKYPITILVTIHSQSNVAFN